MREFGEGEKGPVEGLVRFFTSRLAAGTTTIGFCQGGALAPLLVMLFWMTAPAREGGNPSLVIALSLAGALAAICSGLGSLAGLAFGTGFCFPGIAVAVILRPGTLDRLAGQPLPWLLVAVCSGTFALAFGLAGGFGALLARQGWAWVNRSTAGLGMGGLAGGGVLCLLLIGLQRAHPVAPTAYLASVCLAVLVAFVVGGTQLDAERRRCLRMEASMPFSFSVVDAAGMGENREAIRSCTRDLGLGGLRFETDLPLALGDLLSIQLPLGRPQPVTPLGRVVWDAPGEGEQRSIGVAFLPLAAEHQQELIRCYLDLERRRYSRQGFVILSSMLTLVLLAGITLGAVHLAGGDGSGVAGTLAVGSQESPSATPGRLD